MTAHASIKVTRIVAGRKCWALRQRALRSHHVGSVVIDRQSGPKKTDAIFLAEIFGLKLVGEMMRTPDLEPPDSENPLFGLNIAEHMMLHRNMALEMRGLRAGCRAGCRRLRKDRSSNMYLLRGDLG